VKNFYQEEERERKDRDKTGNRIRRFFYRKESERIGKEAQESGKERKKNG